VHSATHHEWHAIMAAADGIALRVTHFFRPEAMRACAHLTKTNAHQHATVHSSQLMSRPTNAAQALANWSLQALAAAAHERCCNHLFLAEKPPPHTVGYHLTLVN
jgi:hypothetical protein